MKKAVLLGFVSMFCFAVQANQNVHVSRFWHNHQPIYWPEWNRNGSESNRVQFAGDSMALKAGGSGQQYGTGQAHPDNNLVDIFGKDDRRNAYQGGPRNSLTGIPQSGGFAMSYSGSLMDNIRNLGNSYQLGYGPGWWDGNREASGWTTRANGAPRLDIVGFTYHHSLGAVLPKSVLRKEIQLYKEVWWKGWKDQAKPVDDSAHTKGFFPTEMAFSRHMIDVLADEGYEWVIVPSHHLSRTCPTYFDQFDLDNDNYGIFSSPPNKADLLGPSPTDGWWYGQPNPGNAAWNVSPFAYQIHRIKYIDPETTNVSSILTVPSDDVMSYRYGYANEGVGKIGQFISPFATDPNRPVIVMPSSDGDNAWGGGSSSWFEATPQLFNESVNAGYKASAPQDFIDDYGWAAQDAHIEDGAWIFPESDYGSPYFLKWVEPPIMTTTATNTYPGTIVDLETPGFALKFFSWAAVMSGANWVETAEQIWKKNGGSVDNYKIQGPYDWSNGAYTSPNIVERAWHIYLTGLDSGFNYYGGLGNDDEVKPALATLRAQQILQSWMDTHKGDDETGPTIFKPQRFPYNPGAYTFGWFNSIPQGDSRYLKKMPSEFYIWTHVYDLNNVSNVTLKVRVDNDGVNPLGSYQNEVYGPGGEVGAWISIPMTQRTLPQTQSSLNAAANNGQIDYFVYGNYAPDNIHAPEIADYYFSKITDSKVAGFRGKLLDYYIEAVDDLGNIRKTDIQHVFVEDDGETSGPQPAQVSWDPANPNDCINSVLNVEYTPNDGILSNAASVVLSYGLNGATQWVDQAMTPSNGYFTGSIAVTSGVTTITFAFNDGSGTWDNNGGANWSVPVSACPVPSSASISPASPLGCVPVTLTYDPGTDVLSPETNIVAFLGRNDFATVTPIPMTITGGVWQADFMVEEDDTEINVAFRNGDASIWDNNNGADWNWPVSGCVGPFNPEACAIEATPIVTTDPPNGDQNNVGDNFDFSRLGGALTTRNQTGFGSFGQVYVNVDDQALYVGGIEADTGGSNNVQVVFLGLDTLNNDVNNLWGQNGAPAALDSLHNVEFTQPIDIAILIGDEYGDGNFSSFQVGSGYDHGQGIYSIDPGQFTTIGSSTLSQFDGTDTNATLTANDDGNRLTDRWEARIPWSALGAAGPESLNELWIGGLILSDYAQGVDRYLSGSYLGEIITSTSELDQNNNYALGFVTLTPLSVCLPHLDGDADGLPNGYELRYFNSAGAGDPAVDADGDTLTTGQERYIGTNPVDGNSALQVLDVDLTGPQPMLNWSTVGGKTYRLEYNDHPGLSAAHWMVLGTVTETNVADGVESTESLPDASGGASHRAYRVVVP